MPALRSPKGTRERSRNPLKRAPRVSFADPLEKTIPLEPGDSKPGLMRMVDARNAVPRKDTEQGAVEAKGLRVQTRRRGEAWCEQQGRLKREEEVSTPVV